MDHSGKSPCPPSPLLLPFFSPFESPLSLSPASLLGTVQGPSGKGGDRAREMAGTAIASGESCRLPRAALVLEVALRGEPLPLLSRLAAEVAAEEVVVVVD